MTEEQNKFIWLAFANRAKYSEISHILNIPKKTLTIWTKELQEEWKPISLAKRIYKRKK